MSGEKSHPQNSRTFVRFRRFQPSILGTFPHSHLLEEWFKSTNSGGLHWNHPTWWPPGLVQVAIKVIEVDEDDTSGFADEVLPREAGRLQGVTMWRLIHPSFHRVFHLFSGQFHGKFHVKHDVSLIADVCFRGFSLDIYIYIWVVIYNSRSYLDFFLQLCITPTTTTTHSLVLKPIPDILTGVSDVVYGMEFSQVHMPSVRTVGS